MLKTDPTNSATFVRRLIAGVVLLDLLVIGIVTLSLYRSLDLFQNQADITSQNLANVLSQNISNTINKVDLGLLVSADEIERQIASGKPDREALTAFLSRQQRRLPHVEAIRASDATGLIRYGPGAPSLSIVDVSDRDYFIRSRDNPHAGLFISKPFFGRISKDWGINFARRLSHPDGTFSGVVYARISLVNLQHMFFGLDVGNKGAINLRDGEMGLIVHYPSSMGSKLTIGDKTISPEFHKMLEAGRNDGTFYTPTSFDNTPRVVSFRKIDNYPLFVSVGLAKEDYLADWQKEALQMSGLGILFILISAVATWLITRSWRLQLDIMEKLAREEDKFHTIADYTYDWEYWEGSNHEILYMSPSCERVTGYPQAKFVADPNLLVRIIHPDDRHLMDTHLHDAMHEDQAELDFRIVRHDGEIRWISHFCQSVREHDGNSMGRRVTNRDITDRRLFETEINRLAQAVEQNPTGILITDVAGKLTYTNQAHTRITGYTFGEAYGKTLRELISTEMADEEYKELQDQLSAGKPWNGTLQNLHKNGELRWEQISASPIYGNTGNVFSYLYLRTDITERKQTEEELRRYKDHLEEEVQQRTTDLVLARNAAEAANQAKSVFLASMSHELRTPLNAILGFSNMMRRDPHLPDALRQNLDIINRSGEHLLTLINNVLDMAKIEAGRVQLENAPFDLGAMVRDVTDMMDMRAQDKGLQLLLDQTSLFPRYIIGDEARLRQVLINLVGNAIKFTEQGGVTVRLGTRNNKIAHLLIEVEDSGPGIAAEDQQRLFEPFIQLNGQGENKGTGLGLTITRQFVQMMGGHISLESTLGEGSMFRVDLPLMQATKDDIVKVNGSEKGAVVGLAPGQPEYRILIVEDQQENQMLLAKLMESVGFKVKVAENGKEGIQLFQSWQPHFIWMDHRMPVMDGLDAMKIIRDLPGGKEVKIVAVTASAFTEQRAELLSSGMDGFVRKPYRFNEIYECLSNQLGVRFVYEDMPEPTEDAVILTAEMLSALPEELRSDLKNALESLDSERIALVIQQVASYDQQLKKTLTQLADSFDYPAILRALRTN